MKRALFYVMVASALIVAGFFAADAIAKNRAPNFYAAPSLFCASRFGGITLPPVGVFLCPEQSSDRELKAHELVHWEQYRKNGSLGFYVKYLWGWAASGFRYQDNPMERDARERAGEFLHLVPE